MGKRKLTPAEQAKLLEARRWKRRGCHSGSIARIMGLVEGYYVVRFKGSGSFLIHANDWLDGFEPADDHGWEAVPEDLVADRPTPLQDGGSAEAASDG